MNVISKKLSLAALFCTLLLMGLQTAGHATLQIIQANCTISEGGLSAITVSVTVVKNTPGHGLPTQLSGAVLLAGFTGNLGLTANALPSFAIFSSQTFGAVTYKSAEIVTAPFSYLDLKTLQRTQAWMEIHITKATDGTQRLGFLIFDAADNSLIAETEDPAFPDFFSELPLVQGRILTRF